MIDLPNGYLYLTTPIGIPIAAPINKPIDKPIITPIIHRFVQKGPRFLK